MNERPTPETSNFVREVLGYIKTQNSMRMMEDFARKLERERDEAREQLKRILDELYEEQQNHGITKGHLTECRMEANDWWSSHSHVKNENKAMREAIKDAHEAIKAVPIEYDSRFFRAGKWSEEALAKLQPFLA